MKKILSDFTVSENIHLNDHYILLKLTNEVPLPDMLPGQFVEVRIDHTPEVMLRRPIFINFVDKASNMLWLLVHLIGKGTYHLATLQQGDKLNLLLPLGNNFSMPCLKQYPQSASFLLVGGDAGIAPMLFLGKELAALGYKPPFL